MKIEHLFSVAGKVAVVTGGSRGIGEMIARALVDNGARVIITSRKISDCEALAAQLGPACTAIPADLLSDLSAHKADILAMLVTCANDPAPVPPVWALSHSQ